MSTSKMRGLAFAAAASMSLAGSAHAQCPPQGYCAPPLGYPPPPPVYALPPPDPLSAFFGALFSIFGGFPAPYAVPDGRGGFVPFTNSRVMLDGTLRPYDPAIDGYPAPFQGVPQPMPELPGVGPMPESPQGYPAPPQGRPAPPRASGRSAGVSPRGNVPNHNLQQSDCYDKDWNFTGWDKPECRGPQ